MASKVTRDVQVAIPESTYAKLRAHAAKTGRGAAGLAREAIEHWLDERDRLAVHESIAEYAREMAGTPSDLDESLADAAAETLRRLSPSRRR